MRVHIIQRYDDTMKERRGKRKGRGKKGIYIYIIYRWPPPVCGVVSLREHALLLCACAFYMHISAYAHTHIQAHSLMRALTLSCARERACTCTRRIRARARRHACTLAHVGPTTHAKPVFSSYLSYRSPRRASVGKPKDAKRWFSRPRFVRSRGAGLPFLMMHTRCPLVWVG